MIKFFKNYRHLAIGWSRTGLFEAIKTNVITDY